MGQTEADDAGLNYDLLEGFGLRDLTPMQQLDRVIFLAENESLQPTTLRLLQKIVEQNLQMEALGIAFSRLLGNNPR